MSARFWTVARPGEPPICPSGLRSHHQAGEHQHQRRPDAQRSCRFPFRLGVQSPPLTHPPVIRVKPASQTLGPDAIRRFPVRRIVIRFVRHEERIWFNNRHERRARPSYLMRRPAGRDARVRPELPGRILLPACEEPIRWHRAGVRRRGSPVSPTPTGAGSACA